MTIQRPPTTDEIRDAIAAGRPFGGTKIDAAHVAVLSGPQNLTGPLAAEVNRSAADYREQYLTGGGRERAPWHAVYYVTRRADRRVLAYATARGEVVTDETIAADPQSRHPERVPAKLATAVRDGLRAMHAARRWENIATDRGDYPTQPEGHRDGDGYTFTLWGRDTRADMRQTQALAHFTDRAEAYAARVAFEKGGEPYTSPTGYRGTRNHGWITRDTAADTPAIGTAYADHKGQK